MAIRLDPDLASLLTSFIAEFRRRHNVRLSKTDVVEKALAQLFIEYELLPPVKPSA
jgi:hypothetical protein